MMYFLLWVAELPPSGFGALLNHRQTVHKKYCDVRAIDQRSIQTGYQVVDE